MTTTANWFSVDKEGLAKLLERKGKEFILYELVQNGWDTNARKIEVTLGPGELRGYAKLEVTDDHPEGWKDLTHAWTLYAESEKKGNAQKRGRFNLGEKLVLALCREARIETTTGGVLFDAEGRHTLRTKREKGSCFSAQVKMNQGEISDMDEAVRKLLPPEGVETTFNGFVVPYRKPLRTLEATLATEIADAEGILRRTARKTQVEIHEPLPGETPHVYEMGIPVVEIPEDRWSYNVLQKVPLNSDRDNVTPAYLRELRTLVLNEMHQEIRAEEATEPWIRDAAADDKVSPAAVETVMTLRFGDKRVIHDPSDQEGTKIAMSQGYTVIPPRALSGDEWTNVRRFGAALPAGQVTPSPRPYSPDGQAQKEVPRDKWTASMQKTSDYLTWIAREILGREIEIKIVNDIAWPFGATFGPAGPLTLNLGRLGHSWFAAPRAIDELLLHEYSHNKVSDHLSAAFHEECCRLGALLVDLALRKPEEMKRLRA